VDVAGQKQEPAILGREEEQEAIHKAKKLPVVVLRVERASAKVIAQSPIRRAAQESAAQSGDR
jgi:hypothetical protein